MTLGIGIDPQTRVLLTAIGITDEDGQLVSGWFNEPMAFIRHVLSNPAQRVAVLQLLKELLPADPRLPGWHPLLDTDVGNLYVTVEDDVLGIAAALASSELGAGVGTVRGSIRVPLFSLTEDPVAVAGTADGPISVGVDVDFTGPDAVTSGVGVRVAVHLDEAAPPGVQAGVRVVVSDFDLDGGDPVDLVLDSAHLGADLVRALRLLLEEVVALLVAQAPDNEQLARMADHLFELLGISTDDTSTITPLPLEELISRPAAFVDWLVDIVDSPGTLTTWARHLVGLVGEDLSVDGDGTAVSPVRARLLDSDVVDLDLLVVVTQERQLEIGLDVEVTAGPVALVAQATVLRIPLPALPGQPVDPATPLRYAELAPEVKVVLAAPATGNLVDNGPDIQVGRLSSGFRVVGGALQPWLSASDVILADEPHGLVDLTDADAVVGVAADAALGALEDAFGDSPVARALLTLLGLHRPDSDTTTPHLLDPAALGRGPTTAVGGFHRAVLADPAHPWSHMLAQVAVLVGLDPTVTGGGTPEDPWLVPIATAGAAGLSLAGWNARTSSDPAGTQRLRIGLCVEANQSVFQGSLLVELLAVDLPATGSGSVSLVGRSQLRISLATDGALDLDGLQLTCGPASAHVGWRPGEQPTWLIAVAGVVFTVDGQDFGPHDLTLPAVGPDFGLGSDAVRVLGQLVSSALRSWAGESAYALAAALGLHRNLPELPADWPLLADLVPGAGQLQQLLDDPGVLVRTHLHQLLTGMSPSGLSYARHLLTLLTRLLPNSAEPADGAVGSTSELGGPRAVVGSGRYDDPWVVPVVPATGGPTRGLSRVEALVWLEPAGPPSGWIATVARMADGVADGQQLVGFLTAARAFRPELAMFMGGRDPDVLVAGFDALAAWLAGSDGLVPLASQLPAGWTHGTTVSAPHSLLPQDRLVIDQVVTQLSSGSGPVLMVAPPFRDHTIFSDLVTALTGAAPAPGLHFDLRALPDPSDVDLTQVTALGDVYTADLLADNVVSEVDQLRAVVGRIATLTGQPVRIVGHSTAGVVARTLAADHPELVAGLLTLGTPHAGSELAPLLQGVLADAIRVAGSVTGPVTDSAVGATVDWLAGLLDDGGGALGDAIRPGWFTGVAPGLVDTVPAFAIGSQLVGDLFGLLAGSTVTGLAASDQPPTHVSFGLSLGLNTPQPAGQIPITLDAAARVDLARLRLVADALEPERPASALSLETEIVRPGAWLVGDGTLAAGSVGARVQRVEAGLTVTPGNSSAVGGAATTTSGGLGLRLWLRLIEAGVGAGRLPTVTGFGDPHTRAVLDALLAEIENQSGSNPAAQTVLRLLRAAGTVIDTVEGPRASIQGLADLAVVPVRTLTQRRAQLLTTLQEMLGDLDDGGLGLDPAMLTVSLPELPLRLALDDVNGVIRLETTSDVSLAGMFGIGGRLHLDTALLAPTLDVSMTAGPVVLRRDTGGTITIGAEPWLTPFTLRPLSPTALRARLLDLVPDLVVSAVVSAVLGDIADSGVAIPPISALVRDPVGWLRSTAALGNAAGLLDGARINALLTRIAGALDLDDQGGLGLPGGFLLATSGGTSLTDPLQVALSDALGDDAGLLNATVSLALDLASTGPLPTDVKVTPAGGITLKLPLLGDWGDLRIAFSVDAAGVRLVITPDNVGPIQLLPTVSGLGELLGTTVTALVPKVLQEITDALAPNTPHPVLDVALQIAEALGIYDPAAEGFTGGAQVERLRNMLDPGWLQDQVTDPALIIGHIRSLFPSDSTAGVIPLPAGHRIVRVEDRLRWEMDLPPGGELGAELGWAADGHPQVLITLTGLDTGPVTLLEARLGYLDDFEGLVRARVEVGDPLDWFTPELDVSLAGDRLGLRILPLGEAAAGDAEILLLPTPAVVLTAEGGLRLAGSWLLPLITRYVIPQVETLLNQPLWPSGPTSRAILRGAGLVTSDVGPLQIVTRFPAPPVIGLGALKTALSGVSVAISDDLDLSFAEDAGRLGIRLQGSVSFPGDVSVTLLFGEQDWIGDGAGITAWVVGPSDDPALPVLPAPALDVVGVGLQIAGADGDHPLFGGDDDSVVQLGGLAVLLFGNFDFWDATTGQATFAVDGLGGAVELTKAAIRISGSDGDSFVAKLIPQELGAGFTTAIAYRNDQLEVHGGPGDLDNGIELTFPLNLNLLDVIFLRELYLAAVFGQRTDIVAALSGNAELGPIAVTVDRVGLRVTITGSGAVLSFKPPDGFGFSLDASTIRLGGFLLVDEVRGRYVGALEIAILEKFALTAIGIITTKKPDGTPGFSLLMLITVTLPVPIPLGYGFFFAGAGGLLGLNRGMDVDRIRDGLRTGTADSILFPTDIINRIDVIVRDLEESFPAQEGHFLIAPMAMITWMNPALVTLKIGIVLEIAPQPNIALLGVLRLALPTPDAAVVDLKVAFIGGLDIGASLLYFDAAIYDSFIGYADFKLSLEGDIAIRLCWGAQPDLVMSIGGFHPSYTPAAHLKLPVMRRLRLSLLKDNPRLTLQLYFAVTSNTIQFGAQLELFVGVAGFSISGDLGFDVLVQFVPFLIDAHMWGKLAVTAGGTDICSISLDLQLRGPTPWYARGTASFRILFFKISVEVEATFGEAHETSIPAEPVLPKLLAQFRDPVNWAAQLSASASAGVTLLPLPSDRAGGRRRRAAVRTTEPGPARDRHRPGRQDPAERRPADHRHRPLVRHGRGRLRQRHRPVRPVHLRGLRQHQLRPAEGASLRGAAERRAGPLGADPGGRLRAAPPPELRDDRDRRPRSESTDPARRTGHPPAELLSAGRRRRHRLLRPVQAAGQARRAGHGAVGHRRRAAVRRDDQGLARPTGRRRPARCRGHGAAVPHGRRATAGRVAGRRAALPDRPGGAGCPLSCRSTASCRGPGVGSPPGWTRSTTWEPRPTPAGRTGPR